MEVRIILPNYSLIPQKLRDGCTLHKVINVPLGWRNQYCGILKGEQDGITYYLIDNEYYFKRDSLYGHYDDGERFSYFSKAVLECIPHLDFEVDVLHSHDWHTAMVNFYCVKSIKITRYMSILKRYIRFITCSSKVYFLLK